MGDWFFQVLWTVGAIVAIVNACFTARMTYLNHKRMKKRDVADDEYRERTERISRTMDRARINIVGWKIDGLGNDEGRRWLTFPLANKGKAPATIIGTAANYYLERERDVLPPPFDPAQTPLDTNRAGTMLYASDPPIEWSILIPSGTALRKDIENHRVTLYAFFYIAYDDGFGQKQEVCTFVKYNFLLGWEFIPVGGAKYNWNT